MAFWGISGSCREVFLNFASKLCCGLNSLWRGTRTGGSTVGGGREKRSHKKELPANVTGAAVRLPGVSTRL